MEMFETYGAFASFFYDDRAEADQPDDTAAYNEEGLPLSVPYCWQMRFCISVPVMCLITDPIFAKRKRHP